MQGIAMVASSPVRHDSPLNLHALEVQTYQPPWKTLTDFALNSDLDNNTLNANNNPVIHHLFNQVCLLTVHIIIVVYFYLKWSHFICKHLKTTFCKRYHHTLHDLPFCMPINKKSKTRFLLTATIEQKGRGNVKIPFNLVGVVVFSIVGYWLKL